MTLVKSFQENFGKVVLSRHDSGEFWQSLFIHTRFTTLKSTQINKSSYTWPGVTWPDCQFCQSLSKQTWFWTILVKSFQEKFGKVFLSRHDSGKVFLSRQDLLYSNPQKINKSSHMWPGVTSPDCQFCQRLSKQTWFWRILAKSF